MMHCYISKRAAQAESKKETEKALICLGGQMEKLNRDGYRRRINADQLKRRLDDAQDFDPTLFQEDYNRAENDDQRNSVMNQIAAHHATWSDVYTAQKEKINKLREEIVEMKNDAAYMNTQIDSYIAELDKSDNKITKIVTEIDSIKAHVTESYKREVDLKTTVSRKDKLIYAQATANLAIGTVLICIYYFEMSFCHSDTN